MKVGWWEGVIISVFKVFICLIRRVLLTSERGPLYRYPSQLIYWCIYSELSIVGLLRKKGVYSYLFHIKAIIRKFPWSAIDWSELYNGKGPRLLALSIFLFLNSFFLSFLLVYFLSNNCLIHYFIHIAHCCLVSL